MQKVIFHITCDKNSKNMMIKRKTKKIINKGTLKKYKNNGHLKA